MSAEAKDAAADIDCRLHLGAQLSNVVQTRDDAIALINLYRNEGYILTVHQDKFCVILKESATPRDMLKSIFQVNYLFWLERNAGIKSMSVANDCGPGGKLQLSLDYVQREFSHVKNDSELVGWVADGLIARPTSNRVVLSSSQNGSAYLSFYMARNFHFLYIFSTSPFIHLNAFQTPTELKRNFAWGKEENSGCKTETSAMSLGRIRNMRPRVQYPLNFKLILFGVCLALCLFFIFRRNYHSSSSSPAASTNIASPLSTHSVRREEVVSAASGQGDCSSTCSKLPASLAHALLYYSTSTTTPQQTLNEISVTANVLQDKSPCNFLVFGLGRDSLMWSALNFGGRTVFVEEDRAWIKQIKAGFPMLESYHVVYESKVNQANSLIEVGKGIECTEVGEVEHSMCQLALRGLPSDVYKTRWDLIMVDAPTGYYDEAPGRMSAIYTAGMLARNRVGGGETHVFVHDVNRGVEDKFSNAFLCEGYMKSQQGRLRHFTIPSHRDGLSRPFCPTTTTTISSIT